MIFLHEVRDLFEQLQERHDLSTLLHVALGGDKRRDRVPTKKKLDERVRLLQRGIRADDLGEPLDDGAPRLDGVQIIENSSIDARHSRTRLDANSPAAILSRSGSSARQSLGATDPLARAAPSRAIHNSRCHAIGHDGAFE